MFTFTNDWLLELSRWLWDYFLLATVLLAVVLVLGKFLAQPARRMAVHWSTAAGLLLLSLLCAVPGWSVVNLFSEPPLQPTVWVENLGPDISAGYPPQTKPMALSFVQESPNDLSTDSTALIYAAQRIITIDWAILSLYAIAAGSVLFFLWLALGHWQMRRLRSQAKPAPPELEALLPQFIPTGQRTPSLGIVAKLPVAAAVGLRRPMVLLPQKFLELADPEKLQSENIQTVLAHELAHIRHRDLWLLALLRGLLLVLWPHPLYWLWRRSVRLDQETLADAAAADVTDRTHYAEQLVAWARETASEVRRRPLASSVGLWESPSQLKRRIAILLDEKLTVLRECSRRWRVGSALGMLLIAGGLSLITLQPGTEAATDIEKQSDAPKVVIREKATDLAEVANLQELVDSYERIFKKIEAIHKVAAAGGETHKLLLAKYHLIASRAKLLEEKREFAKAIKQYEAALETARKYVPAAEATYDSGNIVLQEFLQAQALRAEAQRTLRQAQVRLKAESNEPTKTDETPEDTFAPATPPAEEPKTADRTTSTQGNNSRVDRTYVDDRFIFCPVKTELQRKLLGISRGESEEASLCVLVHSEALKTESGKIDRKALGYPNITKRLKEYSKENNHLVVFRILGSANTGEDFDDIHDRLEVLSWAFKGLGQHAGFRQCQASTTYGIDWKEMVDRAEQASADTWEQEEPSEGNDLIRAYPVRTFLSRCLTASDCVVDVLPVIRHEEGEVLKPEILESLAKFVPKVEISNRTILLLQLRKTNATEKFVNQLMENISKKKEIASSLGFRNLYLQSTWTE